MKLLNFKKGMNKFAKGIFAIFVIKVLIISSEKINAIEVNKRVEKDDVELSRTDGTIVIDENVTKLCFEEPLDNVVNSGNGLNLTLGDVFALDVNIITDNSYDVNIDGEYCYEVSETDAEEALNPAIQEAKNYLYGKGFSNDDIEEMLDGEREYNLVPVVIGLIVVDSEQNVGNVINFNIFSESIFAQENTGFFDVEKAKKCAIAALGLNIFDSIRAVGAAGFKTAMKKILKNVATKFLGPIGVAITVAEWEICYNYN